MKRSPIKYNKFAFKPKRTYFAITKWGSLFKKHIKTRRELSSVWRLISLKVLDLLLKDYKVVLPDVGTLEIVVKLPHKSFRTYNGNPCFVYPKSELVFTPSDTFVKIFHKKEFATHEIRELEEKTFDWLKKSESKIKFEKER